MGFAGVGSNRPLLLSLRLLFWHIRILLLDILFLLSCGHGGCRCIAALFTGSDPGAFWWPPPPLRVRMVELMGGDKDEIHPVVDEVMV